MNKPILSWQQRAINDGCTFASDPVPTTAIELAMAGQIADLEAALASKSWIEVMYLAASSAANPDLVIAAEKAIRALEHAQREHGNNGVYQAVQDELSGLISTIPGFGPAKNPEFQDLSREELVALENAERPLFEIAESASDLSLDGEGDYANDHVHSSWEGWLNRARLVLMARKSQAPNVSTIALSDIPAGIDKYDEEMPGHSEASKAQARKFDAYLIESDRYLLNKFMEDNFSLHSHECARLTTIGLARFDGTSGYVSTAFGRYVHLGLWLQNPQLPLHPQSTTN